MGDPMSFIHSADGRTGGETRNALPDRFTQRLADGAWSIPTADTAADFGWFPVTDVPRPSDDHVRTVDLVAGVWTEVWTYDQQLADDNAAAAAVVADKAERLARIESKQIDQSEATDLTELARRVADLQQTVADLIRLTVTRP